MRATHTYACIMLLHVKQASTAAALIASPCVFAFAFFALTCSLFLAFINICHNMFHISITREVREVQWYMIWQNSERQFWSALQQKQASTSRKINEPQEMSLTFTFVQNGHFLDSWTNLNLRCIDLKKKRPQKNLRSIDVRKQFCWHLYLTMLLSISLSRQHLKKVG